MLLLSSYDYYKMHINGSFFHKGIDNFKIEHKTCSFLLRDAVPPECDECGILKGELQPKQKLSMCHALSQNNCH